MFIRVVHFDTNEERLEHIAEFKKTRECENVIQKLYDSSSTKEFRDILINELMFEDISEYVCEKIQEKVSLDDFKRWYIYDNWVSITKLLNRHKVFS